MQFASDVREEVLERFLLGFSGTTLPDELAELLSRGLAGVAIYARNYENPAGLLALTTQIRRAAGRPVLIGMDQEGGTPFSLAEPFTQWPSPAALGRLGDTTPVADLIGRMLRAMARELLAVGVNLDFTPMLDLATNPASPVTTGRSFGADPREAARCGDAVIRGLASEGVLACAKHFPGHGDTTTDPHFDLPCFEGSRERLEQQELVPFASAIRAGVPLIMTAHILVTQVDPNRPASFSRTILDGLLRRQMAFEGVILADDLGMGAVARRYGPGESAVKTLEAGTDVVMFCHDWAMVPPAIEAVAEAAEYGRFDPAPWSAGRARIARLRGQVAAAERPAPPLELLGCAEHRAIAEEIQARLAEMRPA